MWGMTMASSGACLKHHLIWGMSGACLGQFHTSAVLHASLLPYLPTSTGNSADNISCTYLVSWSGRLVRNFCCWPKWRNFSSSERGPSDGYMRRTSLCGPSITLGPCQPGTLPPKFLGHIQHHHHQHQHIIALIRSSLSIWFSAPPRPFLNTGCFFNSPPPKKKRKEKSSKYKQVNLG